MTTSTDTQLALTIENLNVTFNSGPFWERQTVHAVKDVSLSVAPGRTLGLVGESGSGKSTIARAVADLVPSTGDIAVGGTDLRSSAGSKIRNRLVQMVFQDPSSSLDPRMKILSSVEEPLRFIDRSMSRIKRRERAAQLLNDVGLGHRMEAYPHELSGGQKQRVAIARALGPTPRVVLCDEPTSGLDLSIQVQVLKLLRELQVDVNCAYLFISHDLRIVRAFSDDIAVMYRGEIVETGPAEDLFSSPQHWYTQKLFDSIPGAPMAATQSDSSDVQPR